MVEKSTPIKGAVPRDFSLQVFFMNHLLPDNNNSVILNFEEAYAS